MKQRDFVVTLTVLGRVMHRIIVRAEKDSTAAHIAKFVAKDINQLTEEEFNHLECKVKLFNELDNDEFFVCF
jgi:hypothetical protein